MIDDENQLPPPGTILSPLDLRDYRISKLGVDASVATFPEEFCLLPSLDGANVTHQQQTSACVAHSLATAVQIINFFERKKIENWSHAFIYGNRLSTDLQSEGMNIRQALNQLLKDGVCPRSMLDMFGTYPQCRDAITQEMRDAAPPQKIAAYARVYTLDEAKAAIMQLKAPLIISVNLYPEFDRLYNISQTDPNRGYVSKPIATTHRGRHAVLMIGWKGNKPIIQNSWGSKYGYNGFAWLDEQYPINEMWSITDHIDPSPQPQPEPTPVSTSVYKFDFGTPSSEVMPGWTKITHSTTYNSSQGFGWISGPVYSVDRKLDHLYGDICYTNDAVFRVNVPNGDYKIILSIGDLGRYPHDKQSISLNGNLVDTISTLKNQMVTNSYQISITNNVLDIRIKDLGGDDQNSCISALEIQKIGEPNPTPQPNQTFCGTCGQETTNLCQECKQPLN